MKMNRIVLSFVAALAGALPLTQGCAGDSNPSDTQPTGTAAAAVTNVPPGVGCVVISAVGAWNTSDAVDVMPGQNVTVDFPVPSGTVAFSAAAYATACAQVTPMSIPNWVSASVVTTVQAGQVTPLNLDLQQSGAGSITVGFTPPPACTAIAKPCLQPAECCSGYCAPNNTCQSSPGGCLPGQTQCGASCVDTVNDPNNCGACGLHCPPGAACLAGFCQPPICPPGLSQCGPACVSTATDPTNCGACGLVCPPGAACSAGVCQPFCVPVTCAQEGFNCGLAGDGCGGVINCGNCPAGQTCGGGGQPSVCGPPQPTCTDAVKDGQETDVDCGGGFCPPCAPGKECLTNTDCVTNACDAVSQTCVFSQCADHHKDGAETDLDCGGGSCPSCAVGRNCLTNTDCVSGACDFITLTCAANQCTDHHKDGTETDVDCGGGSCPSCAVGQQCAVNADCQPGHFCGVANVCQ